MLCIYFKNAPFEGLYRYFLLLLLAFHLQYILINILGGFLSQFRQEIHRWLIRRKQFTVSVKNSRRIVRPFLQDRQPLSSGQFMINR